VAPWVLPALGDPGGLGDPGAPVDLLVLPALGDPGDLGVPEVLGDPGGRPGAAPSPLWVPSKPGTTASNLSPTGGCTAPRVGYGLRPPTEVGGPPPGTPGSPPNPARERSVKRPVPEKSRASPVRNF